MTDHDDEKPSTDFLLGRLSGQMRELIHGQNNMNMAMTGMEKSLRKSIDEVSNRVAVLEAANERREGAAGIISAILKSPAVAWLVGALMTIWAIVSGKLHL